MDWFRIRHTVGMYLCSTAIKRAAYLKKHDILYHIGDNCMTMFRKIPLYPKLISFGDNVWIASQVSFITHDVIHRMLNSKTIGDAHFQEYLGCIDIKDNVFIGSNTIILPNVSIGSNVIIGAGSLINKDIPDGGVYAGVPAKYICSFEEFVEKRKKYPPIKIKKMKNRQLSSQTEEACWQRFYEQEKRRNGE